VFLARPERAAILDELKRRVTTVFMPPTLIYLLMGEARFGPRDFPALRRLTYSAAPMPPARVAEALARFGPVLDSLYGQTEAPMAITALTPADMADPALAGSVGRPFAGTPVRILTADDGVAEVGEGEVLVGGDLARTTYLDDPQATAAARHDGWLRTGDIGRLGADGRLTLIGRAREMIISGGYNIYPAEAETALAGHPAVREVCAFGVDDATWGERLEAAVALSAPVDDAELTAFVRDRLGPVRTPKALHRLDALPRNPVGKVVRAEVKQLIYPAQRPDEGTLRTRETT
jgi:fatty-acyl-CoA synthase